MVGRSADKQSVTTDYNCGAMRDLVSFVQVKKREKHPCSNVTFSNTLPCVFFTLSKLYKWYQIAQSVSTFNDKKYERAFRKEQSFSFLESLEMPYYFIRWFREYMESEDIRDPPVIKQMLKDLANRQASLNSRRIKLLEQLRSVVVCLLL